MAENINPITLDYVLCFLKINANRNNSFFLPPCYGYNLIISNEFFKCKYKGWFYTYLLIKLNYNVCNVIYIEKNVI